MYNLVDHVPWKCEQIHSGVVHLPALSPWQIHSLREHRQTLCQPSKVPNTKIPPSKRQRPSEQRLYHVINHISLAVTVPNVLKPCVPCSGHVAQQLLLQDELALLVLLRALECLVVLPPDHLFALAACNISYDVPSGCHVAVARLRSLGVHDAVEEECFAMLAAEVLRWRMSALVDSISSARAHDLHG
jgi:hypothetical protein